MYVNNVYNIWYEKEKKKKKKITKESKKKDGGEKYTMEGKNRKQDGKKIKRV